MASLQAYAAAWIIRHRLKPRLARATSIAEARRLLTVDPISIPRDITIASATIGGVPGEWVVRAGASDATLLYLHGGGYFACSAETHRPITIAYAQRGFRVFAPDYRLPPQPPVPAAPRD